MATTLLSTIGEAGTERRVGSYRYAPLPAPTVAKRVRTRERGASPTSRPCARPRHVEPERIGLGHLVATVVLAALATVVVLCLGHVRTEQVAVPVDAAVMSEGYGNVVVPTYGR